jgi:hypothetical protein
MHGGRRGPTTTTEHRRIDVRGLLALAPGQMKMAHTSPALWISIADRSGLPGATFADA